MANLYRDFSAVPLLLAASDPTNDNYAARKAYVDSKAATAESNAAASAASLYMPLAGGTFTGNITTRNVSVPAGYKVTLTDTPASSTDAANKQYVDDQISSNLSGGTGLRYTTTLTGDGTTATFTVAHNLGTQFCAVDVINGSTGEDMFPTIERTGPNDLKLHFASAPANGLAIKVVVYKGL